MNVHDELVHFPNTEVVLGVSNSPSWYSWSLSTCVRSLVIASPADQELPSRSLLMIAAMRKDLSYDKLLFVLLGDVLRINLSRVEDKGSLI